MIHSTRYFGGALVLAAVCAICLQVFADEPADKKPAAAEPAKAPMPKPKYPPYAEVLKDATPIDGLIKLHRKDDRLFAELHERPVRQGLHRADLDRPRHRPRARCWAA